MPQYTRITAGQQTIIGSTVLCRNSITITNKRVRLLGAVNLQLVAANATVRLRLCRGAVVLAENPDMLVASDTGAIIDFIDKPGPGTHQYVLIADKVAGSGALAAVLSSLSCEELG